VTAYAQTRALPDPANGSIKDEAEEYVEQLEQDTPETKRFRSNTQLDVKPK
jgi:hypothetical protein